MIGKRHVARALHVGLGSLAITYASPIGAQSQSENRSAESISPSGTVLWNSLTAGMSPKDVVSALNRIGVRAKVTADGGVEVRDKVTVAGVKATIEPAFSTGGLFWIDLRYTVGADKEHDEFVRITNALKSKYGPPKTVDASEVTLDNSVGLITRQGAVFVNSDLQTMLTVNRMYDKLRPIVSDTAIIRYWRDTDATRYWASERRKAQRQADAINKKNSDGL